MFQDHDFSHLCFTRCIASARRGPPPPSASCAVRQGEEEEESAQILCQQWRRRRRPRCHHVHLDCLVKKRKVPFGLCLAEILIIVGRFSLRRRFFLHNQVNLLIQRIMSCSLEHISVSCFLHTLCGYFVFAVLLTDFLSVLPLNISRLMLRGLAPAETLLVHH